MHVEISLSQLVGRGYADFWNWHGRYLVCKGSRGSKKSTTAALKILYTVMKNPLVNALVVRRYYVTHRESTFAQLRWAIDRMNVSHLWKASLMPLKLTYLPTGQVILFRGMDDPQSIASITTQHGFLCMVWVEEAFQIERESDFDKLDLSIRGEMPPGLYKQFIFTFNPWSENWIKSRFFDAPDDETLAMTTDYRCNEFLGQDDIKIFERMKETNPRRYEVEGLGNWGIAQGLVYENWEIRDFDFRELLAETRNGFSMYEPRFGLDFGFSTDPTAFIACLIPTKENTRDKSIYIFDEVYKYGATNKEIYDILRHKQYHKVRIVADSAEPRTVSELQILGLSRIYGAKKGPDSVRAGIQRLKDFRLVVHPSCRNTEVELGNHAWQLDRMGQPTGKPAPDGFHHLLDALRYATEDVTSENFSF